MSNRRKPTGTPSQTTTAAIAGKWEAAQQQLDLIVGAAATDLINRPPHEVALGCAALLKQRHDPEVILGYAAMAITRLGMIRKDELDGRITAEQSAT